MDDREKRHELIDRIMCRGIETYRRAMVNLDGKAKTSLTAGAIVLGIVMGGLGTVAGLAGESALVDWQFLEGLPLYAAIFIAMCFICSLVGIFLSVCFAVVALRVVRIAGFGSASAFAERGIRGVNREIIIDWLSATVDEVYEKAYEANAIELENLEGQCDRMGKYTRLSQWSLVIGLALSLVWASAVVGLGIASQVTSP